MDNYSAVYIGDEEHKNETCGDCHVTNFHNIKGFDVIPSVKEIFFKSENNKSIIKAFASAGYKMRIRGARYYIDAPAEKFSMSPVDGVFDSQKEEIFAHINVSIPRGKHVIYVEAMERNDKWETPASLEINLEGGNLNTAASGNPGLVVFSIK